VGDEPQIGRRDCVPERGQGIGVFAKPAYQPPGRNGQLVIRPGYDILPVFEQGQMEVQPVAGNAFLELRGERRHAAVFMGDVPDDPSAEDDVVGHVRDPTKQELDLELLGPLALDLFHIAADAVHIADLAVGVFDGTRDLGDVVDHLIEDLSALDERRGPVIALLFLDGIKILRPFTEHEKFELAEGVKLKPRVLLEESGGPGQDVVQGERSELPVLRQVAADEVQAVIVEGIQESRLEDRNDIEVGQSHIDHALEERRAVHPLALGQDTFGLVAVRDGDLELLELSVQRCVMEGDALDPFLFDDFEKVTPLKILRRLV